MESDDFYDLTQLLRSLAWRIESCHGRLLSVLEGGYDCAPGGGLQSSIEAHLRALVAAPKSSAPLNKAGRKRRLYR